MRGFQIWFQNTNRRTFNPILEKNCQNLGNFPIFPRILGILTVIWPKSIRVWRQDLESSHQSRSDLAFFNVWGIFGFIMGSIETFFAAGAARVLLSKQNQH